MTPELAPDWLCGAWERPLLRTADGDDVTTIVRYVQAAARFGDLRIPATRPSRMRARALATLDDDELLALAAQQGFAGWASAAGEVVTWTRSIDYQPRSAIPDVGLIVRERADFLLEHGVHVDYLEHWARLADDGGTRMALERPATDVAPPALLVVAGDHFVLARDRATPLPTDAPSLLACCRDATRTDRLRWLDCELSWGRLSSGTVALSTLPEREGAPPFPSPWFRAIDPIHVADADGGMWTILDGDARTLRTLGLAI